MCTGHVHKSHCEAKFCGVVWLHIGLARNLVSRRAPTAARQHRAPECARRTARMGPHRVKATALVYEIALGRRELALKLLEWCGVSMPRRGQRRPPRAALLRVKRCVLL